METKKEPCFKCVVRNYPGGVRGVFIPCNNCMPGFQKKQLKEYQKKLLKDNGE
jgi:hypothetical protein